MANDYRQAIEQAKADIQIMIDKMNLLEQEIVSSLGNITTNIKKTQGAANPKEVTKNIDEQAESVNRLNIAIKTQSGYLTTLVSLNKQRVKEEKEATKNAEKEIAARQKRSKAAIREADAIERVRKSLAKQKAEQDHLSRSYIKLITAQQKSKKVLQDLIAGGKANSRQIKAAQKDYDRLTAKVNKVNKATSNFSKTGLGGMVRGFQNLLGAFGIMAGAQIIASMTKNVYGLIKSLDSLSFSMKAVITDSFELAQTQRWLKDITNNFGAELIATTTRYIKFRAASKEAGLSARETQKIFGTMTKAAGVLGLKTDELTGIYLALEQMISKGKITTEELRRQLGERLPGAMDIMAKSIGVTTAELDAMMKKGEIITKDVLPAFAEQVEIAYGLENITKVETLIAAQTRLQNSWTNLIQDFNKGNKASQRLMKVIDYLADNLEKVVNVTIDAVKYIGLYRVGVIAASSAMKLYTTMMVTMEAATVALNGGIRAAIASMRALKIASAASGIGLLLVAIGGAYELWNAFATGASKAAKELKKFNDEVKRMDERANKINTIIESYTKGMDQLSIAQHGMDESMKLLNKRLEDENVNRQKRLAIMKFVSTSNLTNIEEIGKEIDIIATVGETHKKHITQALLDNQTYRKSIQQNILFIEQENEAKEEEKVKKPKEIIDNESMKNAEKYRKINEKALEGYLDFIANNLKKQRQQFMSDEAIKLENAKDTQIKKLENLQKGLSRESGLYKEINKQKEKLEEQYQKDLKNIVTKETKDRLKLEKELIEKQQKEIKDLRRNLEDELFNLSHTVVDSLLQIKLNAIDEEQEALEKKYDREVELIENSVSSEKNKQERLRQLNKQKERDEEKLEKEREKAEKKAFIINQGIAVLDIARETAVGIQRAKASSLLLPPVVGDAYFATQLALLLGIAGVQTATVLAQTIPAFKQGGEHDGGLAKVGDGGRHEAAVLPSGEVWKTPKSDTVVDLPKGTQIYPDYDKFKSDSERMREMAWKASFDYNFVTRQNKKDTYKDLRKDVMKSLSGLTINNHSHEVANAVKEAIRESNWTNNFL